MFLKMNSGNGRKWTMGIVIAAILAMGSLIAYDMLWGAALVQSTQVPEPVSNPSPPVQEQPVPNNGGTVVEGEDGKQYTVDPDGTVRDEAGNDLGKLDPSTVNPSAPAQ